MMNAQIKVTMLTNGSNNTIFMDDNITLGQALENYNVAPNARVQVNSTVAGHADMGKTLKELCERFNSDGVLTIAAIAKLDNAAA